MNCNDILKKSCLKEIKTMWWYYLKGKFAFRKIEMAEVEYLTAGKSYRISFSIVKKFLLFYEQISTPQY